ncbi:MAG: hypothetical protein GX442_15755, partial [Candidatus Riflebacteria bacterium]|nr:hypothetical protein [Candidatus Riflebacteria bacterium]
MPTGSWGKRPTWGHGIMLVAAVVALAIVWGCGGGGGGSSGPADAGGEAQRITERLSAFMNALGRNGAVREYLSPRLDAATGGGTALASFTVYDFGSDIRNGTSDDQAYTFFVQPS